MTGFSVLNYEEETFCRIASQCCKIHLKEIEDSFAAVQSRESFAESLVEEAVRKEGTDHVHIHFFQNAVGKKKEETNFSQQWNETEQSFRSKIFGLDSSFRVTNIQNVNPIIRDICTSLTHRFRIPATCNMYVSPNEKFNCLGKHSDIQETFIFQLLGHKLWTIYSDAEGGDLKRSHDNVDNREDDEVCPHRKLQLNEGDTLYTPSNLVHRVTCDEGVMSVHLNFALNLKNKMDSYQYFFGLIQNEMRKNADFDTPLNFQSLKQLIGNLQSVVTSLDAEKLVKGYERKEFLESLRLLREGRVYH